MSYFQGMGFKKQKPPKKDKQAKINKAPKNYNGSKPISGKHPAIFVKSSGL